VVNRDRGRRKWSNTILKNAEDVVSTNRAVSLSCRGKANHACRIFDLAESLESKARQGKATTTTVRHHVQ
jgi:hypothetical protein